MQRRAFMLAIAGTGLVAASAARAQFGEEAGAVQVLRVGGVALQTSRLALERSRNSRVRAFAQLEANEQAAVAAALGAQPGSVPPGAEEAAMIQQLAALSGRAFDRMYVSGQITGHRQLLALNSANQSSGDPVGRSVAIVSVPAIQTHLQILEGLA